MEESDFIIAVNKDKYAPIFNAADLGIVGDVNKIIPLLTEKLRRWQTCGHISKEQAWKYIEQAAQLCSLDLHTCLLYTSRCV